MNSIHVNQIFSRPHMNRYRTKSKEVTAIQLKTAMSLNGKNNIRTGQIGDWLVDDGADQFFLTNEQFLDKYEPAQIAPIIWPTNPQWPSGPIYWTSGPNFTQCSAVPLTLYTGVEEQKHFINGPFAVRSTSSCINIPRCIDGMPHNFGHDGAGLTTCSKCGKGVSEALGTNAIYRGNHAK